MKYISKLLRLVLLPCYRMMKSGTFSKRPGSATKGFGFCEFWFQIALFLNQMQFCIFWDSIFVWNKNIAIFSWHCISVWRIKFLAKTTYFM